MPIQNQNGKHDKLPKWKIENDEYEAEEYQKFNDMGLDWRPTRCMIVRHMVEQADTIAKLRTRDRLFGMIAVLSIIVSIVSICIAAA